MKITFHGAARTTTGSMRLVETARQRILLDGGLYQEHRNQAFDRNAHLPFDPKTITTAVLSHAHIDHSGNLPMLVKQGLAGKINCTAATRDLVMLMLRDSARIQVAHGFSAHADKSELLDWVTQVKPGLKSAFVVHGEEQSSLAFAESLRTLGKFTVTVPEPNQTIEL